MRSLFLGVGCGIITIIDERIELFFFEIETLGPEFRIHIIDVTMEKSEVYEYL